MTYEECKVLCTIKRKTEPLITKVALDEYTDMVQKNFDYEFTGESIVYPFELPNIDFDFKTLCIVGASGSGKSTLLKEFKGYRPSDYYEYDDNAIVSNYESPEIASERLSAVGLNSMPVWCRPRRVLSVGEGFRADLALNLESYTIFDEFTSTIDRNVAKSTCNGIKRFINDNNLHHVVFCSCHKDYIPYLCPDIVIDLDKEKVFDCRGADLGETLPYKSMSPVIRTCGVFLGNITI
jgi:ABC-type glutathione transport system ATPase component